MEQDKQNSTGQIDDEPRVFRRRNSGVILIMVVFLMIAFMAFAALAIDVSWLYEQKSDAKRVSDSAALAGDWGLAHGYSYAQSDSLALSIAAANGFPSSQVTVTPAYESIGNNFHAVCTRPEPMFFGAVVGVSNSSVTAASTAHFDNYQKTEFPSTWYGDVFDAPFCLCAYGPDQGATRGDAINARWNDLTGTFTKAPNPLNFNAVTGQPIDYGIDYFVATSSTYSSSNPEGGSKVRLQIYDPQTLINPSDPGPGPLDQYVNSSGTGLSSPATPSEIWRYTLYAENLSTGAKTQLATVDYGESSNSNLEDMWVTPPVGFVFDSSLYPAPTYEYVLNVRTDNGSGSPGTGLDKNGYFLRAGPDIATDTSYSKAFSTDSNGDVLENPINAYIPDDTNHMPSGWNPSGTKTMPQTWNKRFSGLTTMGSVSNLVITAFQAGTGPVSFGWAGPNPNPSLPTIITFNGFDEDSGATAISYTCDQYPGVSFVGTLGYQSINGNGNGVWSTPGLTTRGVSQASTASNTVYFAPGSYAGGTWTAEYTTGAQDVTTWNWTLNYATQSAYPYPYLIYTSTTADN